MTAQILVVDDVPANIKLLEAKLTSEYYDVIMAKDGPEAIEKAEKHKPDLVLLDVMMPGMDGFEVCRKLKENAEISHIPIVMVTALTEKTDRLKGLEAGADDFLTKPINDVALFARVKSLVRIKMLLDEVRLRDKTSVQMGLAPVNNSFIADVSGAKILVVDDDAVQGRQIVTKLSETYKVEWVIDPEKTLKMAKLGKFDAILISTLLSDADGLRLASQIKNQEETRNVPIIVFVDEADQRMFKALELGINDYLTVPVEKNEMTARVRMQVRRKKFQEALKSQYQQSISMAITDALTGLYNRHYLNTHLGNMANHALANSKQLALMIMDVDHFKAVNDTHGHDAGDLVLKQLADTIIKTARSTDLAARFGGEEFVLLMPETDHGAAVEAAGRLRKVIETMKFTINNKGEAINCTVSIGVASLDPEDDNAEALLKRADQALYSAKHSGRNKVKFLFKHAPTG
jgi:two-component system cell cycle response regulator